MSTPAHAATGLDPELRDWAALEPAFEGVVAGWRTQAAGRPSKEQRAAKRRLREVETYRSQLQDWCVEQAGEVLPRAVPVHDLRATEAERFLLLTWTPPGRDVVLRVLETDPGLAPGSRLSLAAVDALGRPLAPQRPGHARLELQGACQLWLLPVTLEAEAGVAGRAVSWLSLPEVHEIEADWAGGEIVRLRWIWPPGVQEAAVAWSFTGVPDFEDASRRVQREGQGASLEVNVSGQGRCHLAVFCLSPDRAHHTPGQHASLSLGHPKPVRYRVVLDRHWLTRQVRAAWVELEGEAGLTLFGLRLVTGLDELPHSPEHGQELDRHSTVVLGHEPTRLPIPLHALAPRTYLRLFFEEPTGAVRLLPATRDKLLLD